MTLLRTLLLSYLIFRIGHCDHHPVYCVNRNQFISFTQLLAENLDSCQTSCENADKNTFYAFNKETSICCCLRKKPNQIAQTLCDRLCEDGNTCGGAQANVYSLYAYCPMTKYGPYCSSTCSCLNDWCAPNGACASDSGGNCKFGRDKWTHKGEIICKDGMDEASDDMNRAKDVVRDIIDDKSADIVTTLKELRKNMTDLANLGNDGDMKMLKEIKSDVVKVVVDQLANVTDSNRTFELLNLLKNFTAEVDEFDIGNRTNPIDVIGGVIDSLDTDQMILASDIISNVLENSIVNADGNKEETQRLYDKANDLINNIGKRVGLTLGDNASVTIDTKMFTTKVVKTTNQSSISFDGVNGPTTVNFKTGNQTGNDSFSVQVTKFKGTLLGDKSGDVFDVKVRSNDGDVTDLGKNQLEYSSQPKMDLNETRVTRFNMTTNNSVPNFLNQKVDAGNMLRTSINLRFLTAASESGRTRGTFTVCACELSEKTLIYKLIQRLKDNCYEIYVKKLNYYREHVEKNVIDVPFMLVHFMKSVSLIFDFVSLQDVTVMVELRTYTFSCVFMNPNASEWRSGCVLDDKHMATTSELKCTCNHLTLFSTLASMSPNNVDLSKSFKKGLGTFLGVYIVITVWIIGVIVCFFAQLLDNRADLVRRPIDLADNKSSSLYLYLLIVNTGFFFTFGMSGEVFILLIGTVGISSPHRLDCTRFKVLQMGSRNLFILRVKQGLGDILKIRIWYHSLNTRWTNWYAKDVLVIDMETKKSYFFHCNYWLGTSSQPVNEISFLENKLALYDSKFLFQHNLLYALLSQHPMISVLMLPSGEVNYSRLERAAVLGTRILGYFMCSLMLYGVTGGRENEMDLFWGITYTLADVSTAFYNTLFLMPVTLTIEFLFTYSKRSVPNPMVISDWRVDTEDIAAPVMYEEVEPGRENEDTEIDMVPETLPACSMFLAWAMIIVSAVLFSALFLLYTMEYGEKKTYSWYLYSFGPTICGFFFEDIISFFTAAVWVTYLMKERLDPPFYYMSAIKWHCIFGLLNTSEADANALKLKRKNFRYKPPTNSDVSTSLKFLYIRFAINILCLVILILLAFSSLSTFHHSYNVYLSNISARKVFIKESSLRQVLLKEDFWKWLNQTFVHDFYGDKKPKPTSKTSEYLRTFDYSLTKYESSNFLQVPCVTRLPSSRVLWNVYKSREIAINGETYCMGMFKGLAKRANEMMARKSFLHNGMVGLGVETVLYVPSADSVMRFIVLFELTYGGGVTTLCKVGGISLYTGAEWNTVLNAAMIFIASFVILATYLFGIIYYPHLRPKKLPLMYFLFVLSAIYFILFIWDISFSRDEALHVTDYNTAAYQLTMSFNMTVRLATFLITFCCIIQLAYCLHKFLDADGSLIRCIYSIGYHIPLFTYLMVIFLPTYLVLTFFTFRYFSRYVGMTNTAMKCLAFLSTLMMRGIGWNDPIQKSTLQEVVCSFTSLYCLLHLMRLVGAAAHLQTYGRTPFLRVYFRDKLPTDMILLRFLTQEEAVKKAEKIVRRRRRKVDSNDEL